jgi:ABC-type transport system substrate-binding protein
MAREPAPRDDRGAGPRAVVSRHISRDAMTWRGIFRAPLAGKSARGRAPLQMRATLTAITRPRLRPVLLALLCAGLAFACQRAGSLSPADKTLTIGTSLPQAGSGSAGVGVNQLVDTLVLEAPVGIGWDGRPQHRVFDNWTWLDHDLGLRLHLQPGIKFHNGRALTNTLAADILRNTFITEGNALSSTIYAVDPVGSEEVVIRTKVKEGFLLTDLSTVGFALPGQGHVGTGPFRYEGAGPPIVLRAFDGYRLGRPALDTVKIAAYQTQRAAWAAMMRGESNLLHEVSHEAIEFVEAESAVQTHSFERGYYDALIFNQHHPVLGQRAVRQAISEAVDRRQIIDLALRKRGTPAKGPFWPYHWALPSSFPFYDFNPERARRRLDEAGVTVHPSGDPDHMPSRLRFSCLVVAEDQRLQRVALVLQKQLYNVGIDLDVQLLPYKQFRLRLGSHEFDSVLLEPVSYRSSAWVYAIWHSPAPRQGPGMDPGYRGADAALELFKSAVHDDEIRAAIAAVQQAMFDDPPAVFIDWTERTRAITRDFEVPSEQGRDILGTIQQWRPVRPGL